MKRVETNTSPGDKNEIRYIEEGKRKPTQLTFPGHY